MLSMARAGLLCVVTLAVSDAIANQPDRRWAWKRTCLAMKEAGLHCQNVSVYGNIAHKFEESALKCIFAARRATGSRKIFRYNFQGRLESSRSTRAYRARRKWVVDFMREHFAGSDVFRQKPPSESGGKTEDRTLLGPYDETSEHSQATPHTTPAECSRQEPYFRIMSQSTFTLCPGGDYAFSSRFWEAIAAGSIPVIHSKHDDIGVQGADEIGYTYFTTREVLAMNMSTADLQRVADANQQKLIKYQTFMYGDQVPPGARERDKVLCQASPNCVRHCSECM